MFVDVVLPLALPPLTFSIDEQMAQGVVKGSAVVVEVGARKVYQGVVWRIHDQRPNFKRIKPIVRVSSRDPLLKPRQTELWEWISTYYMCTLGEVMRAALPAALKPEGLSFEEFAREEFKSRTARFIKLSSAVAEIETLNEKFESLKRAPKQHSALIEIVERLRAEASEKDLDGSISIERATIKADSATLKTLQAKGIIEIEIRDIIESRLDERFLDLPSLTPAQSESAEQIESLFIEHDVVLLHGVTGSGKTELYINRIASTLAKGEDVLFLLPEIALTSQLIKRLERCFGQRVIAYHSKFSDRRRAEIYHRVAREGGNLIVGVRSSIFLPFNDLGLVVVDEEHDTSFKQAEPSPRYHARDCAIMVAREHGAKVLLGSATPSIESYSNATGGKYGLVTLTERYGDAVLPRIIISDSRVAAKRGERTAHFNKLLLDKIEQSLSEGSQVILFQNRRGYSPYVECGECGWVAQCPHCNVSLTLHKGEHKLKCHYCGYKLTPPALCPSCKKSELLSKGFGTEKIEQELVRLFPQARIARLDADTTRSVSSFRSIISDFENGSTDILIGTQMVTKGFDFDRVQLVGVLNADNLLNYPDFRACERAFQMITQVAGRAGRRERQGEVVIQTSQSQHPLLGQIISGNYQAMVRSEAVVRQSFLYPPYCRVVALTLKHRDKALLWSAATEADASLRRVFGRRVLGPEAPAVDRIKSEYLISFIIKIERERSFAKAKTLIREIIDTINSDQRFRYVTIICDVDPQ